MSQNTLNTQAFIDAEVYSSFILENLHDGLLPSSFYRDVSDFGAGTNLNIKTVGSATLQEIDEFTPLVFNPIDTGTVQLQINNFKGDAWSVSNTLREDGTDIDALMAMRAAESTRAFQEEKESNFLRVCNEAQTDADANTINGFAHRIASAETNNIISEDHFADMALAFTKANVPHAGRIAIVDPVVATTLAKKVGISNDLTPFGQMLLEQGFSRDHQAVMHLHGWDIITSNRLDKGDFGDGTTSVTGGVANVFMSILDDQHKPIMLADRRLPTVKGKENQDEDQDEFVVRSRYGIGAQRVDTLGIVITSSTATV